MKCGGESDVLLSTITPDSANCSHKFCQPCFRKENSATSLTHTVNCPCCHSSFFENMQSIDEAILICESANISTHLPVQLTLPTTDTVIGQEEARRFNEMYQLIIKKLEAALLLNPTNFGTFYLLFVTARDGEIFITRGKYALPLEFYRLKLFDYLNKLLDHPTVSSPGPYEFIRIEVYHELARVFYEYRNYSASLMYAKLAYERCLRSSDHSDLSAYKSAYLKSKASFEGLPPLRFAIGDQVEFLYEDEAGSEWRCAKVVELYYRERNFAVHFSAPYRLQLLENSNSVSNFPVYAWVTADIDRYVRKVGVRSIEDTRYQAKLEIKVEELARVYCAKEFMQDVYHTLALDREFVEMLESVWQIELSTSKLCIYCLLVMYRQPLVSTDSGYHVPSSMEVIAGIKEFFNPNYLNVDATSLAVDQDSLNIQVRVEILGMLHGTPVSLDYEPADFEVQWFLLRSIRYYIELFSWQDSSSAYINQDSDFIVPSEVSKAISNALSTHDLCALVLSDSDRGTRTDFLLSTWVFVHMCLEDPTACPACECPFVYFFVKFCIDHNWGVPKLALALYDRMNMQLSREFIRCANPTCELNKLNKSTGKVKFKQCGGCRAVIYCSRECQVVHYPEHKRLCREHSTEKESS